MGEKQNWKFCLVLGTNEDAPKFSEPLTPGTNVTWYEHGIGNRLAIMQALTIIQRAHFTSLSDDFDLAHFSCTELGGPIVARPKSRSYQSACAHGPRLEHATRGLAPFRSGGRHVRSAAGPPGAI